MLPLMRVSRLVLVAVGLLSACGANTGSTARGATNDTVQVDTVVETSVGAAADGGPTSAATTTLAGDGAEAGVSTLAPDATPTTGLSTLTRELGPGTQGPDVLALQQRLNDLHFDVKTPDGYWGPNTSRAIWAYEQLILGRSRDQVTGHVTPEMWQRLQGPLDLAPLRPTASATHVEVFLPQQAMVVFVDQKVRLISHISSGSGEEWCAYPRNVPAYVGATTTTLPKGQRLKRVCGESVTPGGVFKVYRKEKDWWEIPLGKVYNPIYFNGGIAIHGYQDVPFKPASHGCIRVPMHIAEYLPDLLTYQSDVFVWDGVKEPEDYGAQKAPPDKPDPTDT